MYLINARRPVCSETQRSECNVVTPRKRAATQNLARIDRIDLAPHSVSSRNGVAPEMGPCVTLRLSGITNLPSLRL